MPVEQAVTELIVDGRQATSGAAAIEAAFVRAGVPVDQLQFKIDAFMAQQQRFAGTIPQSVDRVTLAYQKLQSGMDPALRAQFAMEREMTRSMALVNRAVTLGVTTEQEAAATIARLRAKQVVDLDRVRQATEQLRQAQIQEAQAAARGGAANDNSFRRTNLGYQAFDIGQGLAAGTPLAIIAAQQGPQIAQLYAAQGGLNALWKDAIGILGSLVRAAGPWIAIAVAIYGAYKFIASNSAEAALAIDDSTAALAAQAAPLASVKSSIDELANLQRTYAKAIAATGTTQTSATDIIIANTKREFDAKKSLLELEMKRQEAALKAQQAAIAVEGLGLRGAVGSQVATRTDLERQGFADPRIGSIPFVRVPDEVSGLAKTWEVLENSPINDKIKELRANLTLSELATEELRKALKATFDDGTLANEIGDFAANIPIPHFRGIDDEPADVDFMRELTKTSAARVAQLGVEQAALDLTGAAAASYQYQQEALAAATQKNIELSPAQIGAIKAQGDAYGGLVEALSQARLTQDAYFDRQQLFRSSIDQEIASAQRGAGLDVNLDSDLAKYMRATDQLSQWRDVGKGFLDDFRNNIRQGMGLWDAFADAGVNAANKILDKFTDEAFDAIFNAAFGGQNIAPAGLSSVATMAVSAAVVNVNGGMAGGSGLASLVGSTVAGNDNYAPGAITRSALPNLATPAGFTKTGIPLAEVSAQGLVAKVRAEYADRFQGLFNELGSKGYKISSLGEGGYSYRNVAGTNNLSKHAFGEAVDINPRQNPYAHGASGNWADYGIDPSATAKKYGLTYGGDWRKPDTMHFQVDKSAKAAAASLDDVSTSSTQAAQGVGALGTGASNLGNILKSITAPDGSAATGGIANLIKGNLLGGATGWGNAGTWLQANPGQFTGLWADGGYTGHGGRMDPAGIVHKGEYVFDAAATARIGVGNLEALRRAPGYADGGPVSMPGRMSAANNNGGSNVSVIVNNAPAGTKVRENRRRGPDGRELREMVIDIVSQGEADGDFDAPRSARYGARPVTATRGR